jgi:branched-chain amino acid transport system permease protein
MTSEDVVLEPAPSVRASEIRTILSRWARWRPAEIMIWVTAFASLFVLPDQHLLLNQIAGLALFVLSIDLILGYAGIVSLGQAAFYGVGAYAAGLFSKFVSGDPFLGLAAGAVTGGTLAFFTSFLVLRGSDLTRLMVTLAVAAVFSEIANKQAWLTGGADGLQGVVVNPIFGKFDFDIAGHTAYAYSLSVLFALFLAARFLTCSPLGFSLRCIRDNPLRASAIGIPVNARLVTIYAIAGAYAGIAGALYTQTQQFVSLDALSFQRSADGLMMLVIGGTGYLYGGLIGTLIYMLVQDAISQLTPQYWQFWIGLLLVIYVQIGRDKPQKVIEAISRKLGSLSGPKDLSSSTSSTKEG